MYVEPDCNLPSGESFIRQILFGKKFYKEEFGVDSQICYIPDSFGFSAALPQIMKKCGLQNFITSKISWNDTVEFPYDLFTWKGLDGSEVTASFITAIKTEKVMPLGDTYGKEVVQKYSGTTYGAFAEPDYVVGTYENFKQKDKSDDFLFPYGYSDGGGGPTFKHLKCLEVMSKNLRNCGNVRFSTLNEFVDKLNQNIKDEVLDVWKGELYLQYHRGTLTSMAACKRYNRKAEFALMNLELLYSIDSVYFGGTYPSARLNAVWEKVLVNQFHDILPGSSIAEQYDITLREYAEIFEELTDLEKIVSERLAERFAGGYLVFNGNSFAVSDYVEIDGKYRYVENIPPKGIKAVSLSSVEKRYAVEERKLENKYCEILFNEKYEIVSLFDKVNGKQVLSNGEVGNRLRAYVDMPHVFDAWEIQDYYKENYYAVDNLASVEFVELGEKYGWKIQRKFRNSVIEQFICLYENKEGLYFETTADWKEEHLLLKAEFPVCVQADKANYDIQFGHIERSAHYNTPWDKAQFEVCGHKYADYSDGGFGVSLLNDCKYGYDIHNGVMSLSLIKCATDPNERADKGVHNFTYAIYSHSGGLQDGKTIRLAYSLNNPLKILAKLSEKENVGELCFVQSNQENVIVDTVKQSENGDASIIRLFESNGKDTRAELVFGKKVGKVYLCNMLEEVEKEIETDGCTVTIDMKGFEIITLKIVEV